MKSNILQSVISILLFINFVVPVHAQVTLDGTIGTSGNLDLPGPDYDIKSEYGHQAGTNLFHSFQQFSINTGESATFRGPDSVQNIISRVTGGYSSWIDGKLCSAIPGADLYLLNPSGVMFGPNASLDMGGSFHVSTADYLRMGENERFYSMSQKNDILSVSDPTAFGFLDDVVAPIFFEGKGRLAGDHESDWPTGINVGENTLSIIGGDIKTKKGTYYNTLIYGINEAVPLGSFNALGGRINLASVASSGEVVPTESDLDVSSFETLGKITISDKSRVDASWYGSGDIFIRGEQLVIDDNSYIQSDSVNYNGGIINIELRDTLQVRNHSAISNLAFGKGNAGNIILKIPDIEIKDAQIMATTMSSGNGGDIIMLEVDNLKLYEGALVHSYASTYGGKGGNVVISATDIVIADKNITDTPSGILTDGEGESDAGNIILETKQLTLNNEGFIASRGSTGGDAGDITINGVNSIYLSNKGSISTEARDAGGGKISIDVKELIHLSESKITSNVDEGEEDGGNINIDQPQFVILNNGEITAKAHKGQGGNIHIATDHYIESSDSDVNASSKLGIDGSVDIESPDEDVHSGLSVLPSDFLDAARWLKTRCAERTGETASHLVFTERDGMPTSLDDWLASPLLAFDSADAFDLTTEIGQLLAKGEEFYHKGDLGQTVHIWEQAILRLNREQNLYYYTLFNLAHVYQAIGHHRKARSALREISSVMEQSKEHHYKALFYTSLGDLSLSIGKTRQAKEYLEKGVEEARQTNNPAILASALNNMGNALATNGNFSEAMSAYEQSFKLIEDLTTQTDRDELFSLKSKVLINAFRVRVLSHDYENDVSMPDNILSYIRNLPDSHDKAADLVSLSLLANRIRKNLPISDSYLRKLVYNALQEAGEIAQDLKDTRIISYASGYLGHLYEEEKQYADAIDLTRNAIFSAQQGYYPELLYLWQWQLGRLFRSEGHIENAITAYNKAIDTLGPVRPEFFKAYRGHRNIFDEKIKPVYTELAELMLEQAKNMRGGHRENKLCEARDTIELLKTYELQDFFEDECVTAKKKNTISLDRIPSQTAMIYPVALKDSLAILLSTPGGMKIFHAPVGSEYLTETAKEFRKRLQKKSSRFLYYSKMFYNWIIKPVRDELEAQNIGTLVIAPDRALRLIPFSALHDGSHFLVEKYAIVRVPAITLTDSGPTDLYNARVLLNGLSEARQGFSPLPNVPKELKAIKKLMQGKAIKVLKDREFTNDNLNSEFMHHEYSVVHMATHGNFGNTPQATYLLTHDSKLTMNDLEKLINIGRFRDEQVSLLTLSACETAMGDERAALGLGGIALKAGVKSAIATLWHIDDKAASMVITEFYRGLEKAGQSKAKSLQNAQKKLISNSVYNHPAYWSPFLMIGNWN